MKDLWSSCLISLERATATNTIAMNRYWCEYTEIENRSHDLNETKTKERIDLKWKVEIEMKSGNREWNVLICVFVNEIEWEW